MKLDAYKVGIIISILFAVCAFRYNTHTHTHLGKHRGMFTTNRPWLFFIMDCLGISFFYARQRTSKILVKILLGSPYLFLFLFKFFISCLIFCIYFASSFREIAMRKIFEIGF